MPTPLPSSVLQPPGLIGAIAKWIDTCAVHPAPLLSVTSALATVATVAGRGFSLPSGARANSYYVAVARSGVGKEVGRQCAISLLTRAGLKDRVGTGSIASGAGLVKALSGCPIQLFLLDEFGRMLDAYAGANAASHEREIMTTLMQLWGTGDGTFLGKAYAEKDRVTVEQPHTVMYATTTPDQFFSALKGRDVVDGVLSRMLIVEVDHDQLPEVEPTSSAGMPPQELIEAIRSIVTLGRGTGNLGGSDLSSTRANPVVVPLSQAAKTGASKIGASLTGKLSRVEHRDLWVRAKEQALRVALCVAVGCGSDTVEEDHLLWSWSLVRWCTQRAEEAISARVADTVEGRARLAVLRALEESGGQITSRDLVRSKHLRAFDRRVREVAIKELVDADRISCYASSAAIGGPPRVSYALTHDQPA